MINAVLLAICTVWSAVSPFSDLRGVLNRDEDDAPAAHTYEQRRTRGPAPDSTVAPIEPRRAGSAEGPASESTQVVPVDSGATLADESSELRVPGPSSVARARAICDALAELELGVLEGRAEQATGRARSGATRLAAARRVTGAGRSEQGARAEILDALFAAADRKLAIPGTRPERWVARARASAALPVLSAGLDHRRDDGWNLDQSPGTAVELSSDVGTSRVIRSRATWELDRLIFNVDELRAARALLDLAELKERIHLSVATYYQERADLRCRARLRQEGLTAATTLDQELAERERVGWLESQIFAWTGIELGNLPW